MPGPRPATLGDQVPSGSRAFPGAVRRFRTRLLPAAAMARSREPVSTSALFFALVPARSYHGIVRLLPAPRTGSRSWWHLRSTLRGTGGAIRPASSRPFLFLGSARPTHRRPLRPRYFHPLYSVPRRTSPGAYPRPDHGRPTVNFRVETIQEHYSSPAPIIQKRT